MSNPPFALGLLILSHLIQAIFLPLESQSHKNLHWIFEIFLYVEDGALKNES